MILVEVKEMKFSEKLQMLRKENKMSQEQLADQLEVSRQAVSKWESGQTYPEMDKLISICKLFKCSLDDLTNDEITEIKRDEKEKVTISKFIDEILDTISRSASIFRKLSLSQKLKYIFGLFVLILVLLLIRIPVDYIYDLGANIFESFRPNIRNVLCSIWNFILSISYLIFSVICFYYLYKVLFLERWENISIQNFKDEKSSFRKQETELKMENIDVREKELLKSSAHSEVKTSVILKVLNTLASCSIKVCSALILFPFLFVFFFIVVAIILTLYFIFQGAFFLGVLCLLIGGFVLCYLVIQILFSIITSRKQSVKQIGILFLVSLTTLGIGTGISVVEFSTFTYHSGIPDTNVYKRSFVEEEFNMTENFSFDIIGAYDDIEYVTDEDLESEVRVQVEYYQNFNQVSFSYQDHLSSENSHDHLYILTDTKTHIFNPWMREAIFDSLKEKQFYNYGRLERINVVVFASQENIDKMKENYKKMMEENKNQFHQEEISRYQDMIDEYRISVEEYQALISEKDDEIGGLQNKIETLEVELEEMKTKISEYRDQISSIITE